MRPRLFDRFQTGRKSTREKDCGKLGFEFGSQREILSLLRLRSELRVKEPGWRDDVNKVSETHALLNDWLLGGWNWARTNFGWVPEILSVRNRGLGQNAWQTINCDGIVWHRCKAQCSVWNATVWSRIQWRVNLQASQSRSQVCSYGCRGSMIGKSLSSIYFGPREINQLEKILIITFIIHGVGI